MIERGQPQTWVDGAQRGDPAAVSKLLAKYHAVLRAQAGARMDAGLKAKVEPQDMLQEVYLHTFRHIDRFEDRGPNSFLNWVLTILDHKISDARRVLYSQKRDVAREVSTPATAGSHSCWNLFDLLCGDSCTPSRVVRRDEAVGAVLACVAHLSDTHRKVIQLRFLEGCSVAEVAGQLNKPKAVVVAATKSALKALRESMNRLGEFTRGC